MTSRLLATLALSAVFSVRGVAQAPTPSSVTGHWTGTGTFFDTALNRRVGTLSFELNLEADGSGSGRLGVATVEVTGVRAARDVVQVMAKLSAPPAPDAALSKRYVAIVITAADDSTLQGEFHLKSNSFYDPWMREGRLALSRVR